MSQKSDDLASHLLIGKPKVDSVLQKGEEDEAGADTTCLRDLPKQSKADFIGKDG